MNLQVQPLLLVSFEVTVVGDLHGQLFDFDHMLSLAGSLREVA